MVTGDSASLCQMQHCVKLLVSVLLRELFAFCLSNIYLNNGLLQLKQAKTNACSCTYSDNIILKCNLVGTIKSHLSLDRLEMLSAMETILLTS